MDFHWDSALNYILPTTMQIVFTFANIFLGKKNFHHADCAYRRILTKQFVDKLPTNGRKEQTSFTKFFLQDWWSSAGLVVQVRTGGAVTGLVA